MLTVIKKRREKETLGSFYYNIATLIFETFALIELLKQHLQLIWLGVSYNNKNVSTFFYDMTMSAY